jgi:HEAT repeat protein
VGLSPDTRAALVQSYKGDWYTTTKVGGLITFDPAILLRHLPKANRLPLRYAPECQLSAKEAATLGVLSPKLHAYLDLVAPKDLTTGQRADPTRLRDALRRERRGKRPEWLRPEAVPALLQILMAEDVPLRLLLVDILAEIDGKAATVALARRAAFDTSLEVRHAAIDALGARPRAEYRPILVDALRYPWPPAADHAAEALVALEDREAAPLLVALLGKPDPAAPYSAGKSSTYVRHIVRVNHLGNCLLCHVPAINASDPVIGIDPIAKRPPDPGGRYSDRNRSTGREPLLIRPDVAFFRQDFSVSFPVGQLGIAMDKLRFDYLVCTRPLTRAELRALKQKKPSDPTAYPQREATLFALRALTGQDAGPRTEAWLELYPHADAEAEGVRLSAALLRAARQQRDRLLTRYRDAKAEHYTPGLARAIPHLEGPLQEKARKALVERLARLSAAELRRCLNDDDAELRRAAALACVQNADKELVPDLIELLLASEPVVASAAHESLQRLTGRDFGPASDAGKNERTAAAAEWRAWWRNQIEP